MTTFIG